MDDVDKLHEKIQLALYVAEAFRYRQEEGKELNADLLLDILEALEADFMPTIERDREVQKCKSKAK
jgi:hypothetical protein